TTQFAMVPLNLLRGRESIDFVHTGEWSKKAIKEAKLLASANIAASAEDRKFTYVPPQDQWRLDPNAAYVHICANETNGGVEYHWVPDTGAVPLVADVSSNFLSHPMDVAPYGLLYGGAQQNIGPAGLTTVILREALPGQARRGTPTMLDYKPHADADSVLNTPPTFAVYVAGLVFQWLERQGGV